MKKKSAIRIRHEVHIAREAKRSLRRFGIDATVEMQGGRVCLCGEDNSGHFVIRAETLAALFMCGAPPRR